MFHLESIRPQSPTRRAVAVLTVLLLCLAAFVAAPAQASAAQTEPSIATPSIVRPPAIRLIRVCPPKGKCVAIPSNKYCWPGSGCGAKLYKVAKPGAYCSSSTGCIRYKGQNYYYVGYKATKAQLAAARKCAATLGFAWVTAAAGGPVGLTIAGVPLALWTSCS